MLLTKEVEITLHGKAINYYKAKGYDTDSLRKGRRNSIPKGTKIKIKIDDVNPTSKAFVDVKCDYCGCIIKKNYASYLKQHSKHGLNKDSCKECTSKKQIEISKKFNNGKRRKSQISYDELCVYFKERNCELITKEYINQNQKLEFVCNNHIDTGIQTKSFDKIKINGWVCKHCAIENRVSNSRKDLNIVYDKFKELNATPLDLDNEYKNKDSKLSYICNIHNHKVQYGTWSVMKRDGLCYYCGIDKNSGENHSRWNGGTSSLIQYTRAKTLDWKYDTMRLFDYKCCITGLGGFEIHHLYPFKNIFEEMIELSNLDIRKEVSMYTTDELNIFENIIKELHIEYGLGAVIKTEIHSLFHSNYGYGDNTHLQFTEFTNRLIQGEFDDYLKENNLTLNINYEALNKLGINPIRK